MSLFWRLIKSAHTHTPKTKQTTTTTTTKKTTKITVIQYYCSLCYGAFGGMLILTIRNSYVILKPEVLQYLENR